MQFWFARGSEVSIREQLVTQIVLGILSDDLAPGQRLPSTRDLARRFRLHPNTISAGYRQLEREGWVEFRHGSGVYVRAARPETAPTAEQSLDQAISRLFRLARELHVSLPLLRSRLQWWLELQPPDHFLLIEPDEELRAILAAEIARAVTMPVESCGPQGIPKVPDNGVPLALPNRIAMVRRMLSPGRDVVKLQVRSVPDALAKYLPAPTDALVAVASRWPEFLKLARAVLNAVGFHADSLIFRDARQANWQRGLKQSTAVVCDLLTAAQLPKDARSLVFPLVSASSIAELQRFEKLIRTPIESL